jgi:porin
MNRMAGRGVGRAKLARRARFGAAAAGLTVAVALAGAARADDAPPSVTDSFPALAPVAAFKKDMAEKGVGLQLNYIGDVLGNLHGGQQTGAGFAGRLEGVVDADMEKLFGLTGGAFHVNGYWIQGTGLSAQYVGNIMPVSSIEALPTVRLFELWYEQKLLDGKLAIRFGQLAADSEFLLSKYSALFIGGTFGWAAFVASDLPSGGPAYPLATPGVRVKLGDESDAFNILMAVYNGNPAGPGYDNPQKRDLYGVNFTLEGPPLAMEEVQYRYNQGKDAKGLAGSFKLGGFQHFGNFDNQRYDGDGLPMGLTGNNAGQLRGNWGVYGVWDQQVLKFSEDGDKYMALFVRVAGTPQDRNLINFYIDGGLNFAGLVPGRPNDVFGVAGAYAQISNSVRGLDYDMGVTPVRNYEAAIEVTYQAQIVPGWTVQPDFQYIFNPGGNIADGSGQPAKNAVVIGLRTTIAF